MADTAKLDQRIKRLTRIEAEYRSTMKRANADMRDDPDHKRRYELRIAKLERKIDKLVHKVRRLREVRTAMRSR